MYLCRGGYQHFTNLKCYNHNIILWRELYVLMPWDHWPTGWMGTWSVINARSALRGITSKIDFISVIKWDNKTSLKHRLITPNSSGGNTDISNYLWYSIHNANEIKSGPWFNIKMSSYQYMKSRFGYKTVVRPSYLHHGIPYTGKMSSLYWIYWIGDQGPISLTIFPSQFKFDGNFT